MAPPHPRRPIAKDRFAALFPTLKVQTYHDPASRGPGSHTIRTIAWNPTGHLIATGSADRTLRIWNPEKPQVKNSTELRGHTGGIERVAWNPTKEAELASVSSDGSCRFWDVRSKTCTAIVQLGGEGLTIAWAADGSAVMVGRKDDTLVPITIHPTPTAQPSHAPALQTNQCTFNHTSPPSHLLLTRGDGSVTIASYPSLQTLHTLHAHTSSCLSLALSPTSRYLAIGGSDALISLYDTTDWVCKRTLTNLTGAVKSVGFSFDGSFVVGGSDEGNVLEVAHTESGEYVGKVDIGASGGCGVVAWHPGRYWIAWAGEGAGLKILGAAGGQL
ncbi:MAG: hypothetical protein ALECFALPRED_000854 [Alectoria fallacina]|uniref:WD40 repeat-like protein n=1 Tax=Alectoria fallacina TaxID=1903189 RepID=A0A8H3JAB6_9LECA|nr:MAG: hypothetical protein ALECFALPRED_000854 [Alectoria fallacina]